MAKYETHFIPQNKAPKGAKYIDVYDGEKLVGKLSIGSLKMPELGNKLYSFGALSDVHITNSTFAMEKFKQALEYFNNTEKVAFTCIAGDLTSNGSADNFATYRNTVAPYSAIAPVYEITGNHDVENTNIAPFLTKESTQPYIGRDMYYSFTQGNDLFIMFGMSGWIGKTGDIFTVESLQWLYEILEANRNKRCFVFEHCPNMVVANGVVQEDSGSGSIIGLPPPTGNLLNQGSTSKPFRELMAHYKNVIWVHGHSHIEFKYQEECLQLNYERKYGCHSIHIPSSASGRTLKADGSGWENPTGSYGYVVDVYENYIVLRGRDFVADAFAPIATFCLDTTPQTIPEKTFTDSTGTIIT
jgi:predicted phosphodiesterase